MFRNVVLMPRTDGSFSFLRTAFAVASVAICLFHAASLPAAEKSLGPSFRPGDVWRDTEGKPINAHGGGLLFHEGVYYWYGEFKEGQTYVIEANKSWGGTRVLAGGVSCYSSTNLYDWKNEGIVLPPVPDQPSHDLHSEKVIERPKVIYNARTQKFVMWFHQDSGSYAAARTAVAVSDTPTGRFRYKGSLRPNAGVWPVNVRPQDKVPGEKNLLARDFVVGQMARDQTVFVDDDGAAYQFYASEGNATLHVSRLTDDYLQHAGRYARILEGRSMEAPAVFKRGKKYYLLASGCTGWAPNAARTAMADHIFGPWTELENPCRGPNADKTFNSQSTYVLRVPGKEDAFIALFDQWKQWDLEASRYAWLPFRFEKNQPVLEWQDAWTLNVFVNPPTISASR
jgi:beta-galactosidase